MADNFRINIGEVEGTFTIVVGETKLVFHDDGRVFFNGRQITEDIDLVNGLRDLVGLGTVNKVMEE